jgi:hypothetical protein
MNDNDPRTRAARLERTLAQVRLARHRRTTARLLLAIAALTSALVALLLRRYGFF